jgi:hypothetical protein
VMREQRAANHGRANQQGKRCKQFNFHSAPREPADAV